MAGVLGLAVLLLLEGSVLGVAPEFASASSGDCAITLDGAGNETTEFPPGGEIQVHGDAGCAGENETGIDLLLDSSILLATFAAEADGSYESPVATLPSDVEPGAHEIVVETESNTYVQPIEVTSASGLITGLSLSSEVFSPNGDGCLDSTVITVTFDWPADATSGEWSVEIQDRAGRFVFSRFAFEMPSRVEVPWDGTDEFDDRVDDGPYRVVARAMAELSTGEFVEDEEEASVEVDSRPPQLTARFPERQGADVEGPGGSEASIGASVGTAGRIWARFDESLDASRSSIEVLPEAGVPVEGTGSYDDEARELVFEASTPMAGTYRAEALAVDRACNAERTAWGFTGVAP